MRVLTLAVDAHTIEYLDDLGFRCEAADAEDFDLAHWLADDLFDAAVLNLDAGLGLRVCREARERGARAVVVGLCVDEHAWSESRATFLEQGGDDLMRAPVNPRELAAVLRSCARRVAGAVNLSSYASCVVDGHVLRVNQARAVALMDERELHFSRLEFSVLALLFARNGAIVSKESFANSLWADTDVEIKIVDVMICRIRNTLEACERGTGGMIETVWGRGYRLRGEIVRSAR